MLKNDSVKKFPVNHHNLKFRWVAITFNLDISEGDITFLLSFSDHLRDAAQAYDPFLLQLPTK